MGGLTLEKGEGGGCKGEAAAVAILIAVQHAVQRGEGRPRTAPSVSLDASGVSILPFAAVARGLRRLSRQNNQVV